MLWTTKDSGHTYTPVKDLSTDIRNYPADMAFRNKSNGMILTSYHGEDTYEPDYAIKLSAKNFAFEDRKKIVPLYAAFCI